MIGGVTAALLWELSRHALVRYFGTLSQISTVYGSLTTAIAALLSLELAAALLLLLGAPAAGSALRCRRCWRGQAQMRRALAPWAHRRSIVLYTLAVVLLILWVLGLTTSYTVGGLLHLLLVVAVIMVVFQLISGRRVG